MFGRELNCYPSFPILMFFYNLFSAVCGWELSDCPSLPHLSHIFLKSLFSSVWWGAELLSLFPNSHVFYIFSTVFGGKLNCYPSFSSFSHLSIIFFSAVFGGKLNDYPFIPILTFFYIFSAVFDGELNDYPSIPILTFFCIFSAVFGRELSNCPSVPHSHAFL